MLTRVRFYSYRETQAKTGKKIQVTYFLKHPGTTVPKAGVVVPKFCPRPISSVTTSSGLVLWRWGSVQTGWLDRSTRSSRMARAMTLSLGCHSIFLWFFSTNFNDLPLGDKSLSTSSSAAPQGDEVAHNFSFSIETVFVSMSIRFRLPRIFLSSNTSFSKADLMKWYLIWMCLVLAWYTGFFAKWMAL